jgi:hypothetical protein
VIDDPNFALDLGQPWQEMSDDIPQQYSFRDATRDIVITLSAMSLDIAPGNIAQFASMLVDSRLRAEGDAARALDHRATIYEPIVVPRPWGRAVAYYGHDDTGRRFSFSGMVTPRSAISLYMSTGQLSERELMTAIDEVGSRIVFDRTSLDAFS